MYRPTNVSAWALKIPPSQKSRYLGTCVLNGLWRKLSLEGQYKVKRMLEVLDLLDEYMYMPKITIIHGFNHTSTYVTNKYLNIYACISTKIHVIIGTLGSHRTMDYYINFVDRTDGINSKTPLLIWLTDSSDEYFDKRSSPRGCKVLKNDKKKSIAPCSLIDCNRHLLAMFEMVLILTSL